MTVIFYMNNSPENFVHKDITQLSTYDCTLRETTDITRPVILISGTNNIVGINYAFLPDFARYYYVDNVVSIRNEVWEFHLRCDVLKSFWNDIKTCECIIERNEYARTKDLQDSELYATADSLYEIIKFPNSPFNVQSGTDKRFVLIVQGG